MGRRYDHGTNAKVCCAFDFFAYILESVREVQRVSKYRQIANQIKRAITETMVACDPSGSVLVALRAEL